MHLGLRQVLAVGQRAGDGERKVVLPPHDEGRRLVLPKVGLPSRIRGDIGAVIVEELQLDVDHARSTQERVFALPGLRIDPLGVRALAHVPLPGGLERQEVRAHRGLMRRPVGPERSTRRPEIRQPLGVGDGVLHDQRVHALGVGQGETEPDRAAIVLQVEGVAVGPLLLQEVVDDLRQVVEGIQEHVRCRRGATAEPWIVRRQQMEPVGQTWNQLAEHHRRGRKPMQEDERRVLCVAGLPVENAEAVDRHRPVPDRRAAHGHWPLRRRIPRPGFRARWS